MNFNEIQKILNFLPSNDEKFDFILDLSKNLEKIPSNIKLHEISGCASVVKIGYSKKDNIFHFYGFADSKMVAGILYIIFSIINNKSKKYILDTDILSNIKSLNLPITSQRQIGITSIMNWIKTTLDNIK